MGTRREVRDERQRDSVGIELPAGCVRHDPDAAAVDDEPSVRRLPLESAEPRQELLPEAVDVEPDPQRPVQRLRRHEARQRRDRKHGRRVAKAHLTRAVEEARHRRAGPFGPRSTPTAGACARNGTPSSAGSVRRPRRSAARSTSVPGAGFVIEIEAVSASIDEIGVLRLLAEAPVEPVRELRRSHRAEPVGDVDVRCATEADVPQKPLAGACVDRDVERRVEEWPGSERAARHPLLHREARSAGSSAPREPARRAALRPRPRRVSSHRRRLRRSSSRQESSCARTAQRRRGPQPRPRR